MTKKYRFIYLLVFIQYSAICGCIILLCMCLCENEWMVRTETYVKYTERQVSHVLSHTCQWKWVKVNLGSQGNGTARQRAGGVGIGMWMSPTGPSDWPCDIWLMAFFGGNLEGVILLEYVTRGGLENLNPYLIFRSLFLLDAYGWEVISRLPASVTNSSCCSASLPW